MNHYEFDDLFATQPELRISPAAREQHQRMIEQLTKTPPRIHQRSWHKIFITMGIAIGVSAAGLGTAAAFGAFSPPTDRRIASCFTTADLHDPTNRQDFTVALSPDEHNPSLHDAAASALDICASGWQQGQFSLDDPKVRLDPPPAPWNYPVPPLVACVLPNGTVGIFPGDETTCATLRLPVAQL